MRRTAWIFGLAVVAGATAWILARNSSQGIGDTVARGRPSPEPRDAMLGLRGVASHEARSQAAPVPKPEEDPASSRGVTLRIVRADGVIPDRARVYGRDDDVEDRAAGTVWTPEEPTLPLEIGSSVKVRAGAFEEWGADLEIESAVQAVVLEPRYSLAGRVVFADTAPMQAQVRVRSFDGAEHEERFLEPDGTFVLEESLEPGNYVVGVSSWRNGPIVLEQNVVIGQAPVLVEFRLPPRDRRDGIVLHAIDERGAPLSIQDVHVHVRMDDGHEAMCGGTQEITGDGAWVPLRLPGLSVETGAPGTVRLFVHVPDWGRQELAIRLPSHPLRADVRFLEPAVLDVEVPSAVLPPGDLGLLVRDRGGMSRVASAEWSSEGRATLGPLQPGTYSLAAVTQEHAWKPSIELGTVTLRSGRQFQRVALPPLHAVTVRWRRSLGDRLGMKHADGWAHAGGRGLPDGKWLTSEWLTSGGSHLLPEGTYRVRVGDISREVTITGPAAVDIER